MQFKAIHERAVLAGMNYKKSEAEVLNSIMEVDSSKNYFKYDCPSLFAYAVKYIGLTEASASNFIAVARKSKTVPSLKEAVEAGELSVATARKITPVITFENSAAWIEKARQLPKMKLEKEVAKIIPRLATQESAKYVSETRLELKLGITEETLALLKRAQDLLSQKSAAAASFEDTLEDLLKTYLEKNDPLEKAKRQRPNAEASVQDTRYIPKSVQHAVNLRDQSQCSHQTNGKRCENRRWLQIHHIKPFAQGGTHATENLTTLCSAHHRLRHTAH